MARMEECSLKNELVWMVGTSCTDGTGGRSCSGWRASGEVDRRPGLPGGKDEDAFQYLTARYLPCLKRLALFSSTATWQ